MNCKKSSHNQTLPASLKMQDWLQSQRKQKSILCEKHFHCVSASWSNHWSLLIKFSRDSITPLTPNTEHMHL